MSWDPNSTIRFETPDGTRLNTLKEAVAHLARTVPKSQRDMPAVTTAAETLTNAAERELAWMFLASAAVLQAIKRHEVRQFNPDAKTHHWGKRRPKRDQ